MSRHSKHCNDRSFYSYKERVDAGFAGTRKDILGTDAFLPFGYCGLSLKPPRNAVATPDGHIFDKEYILENLLSQKMELEKENSKYQDQERKKARKDQAEQRELDLREIKEFQKADQGLLSEDARHKRALDRCPISVRPDDDNPAKRLRQGELLVVDKGKHREKSFWAKEQTPSAAPTEMKKVDMTPKCPLSGKKLRVKDLVAVEFEATDQKMLEGGGGRGVFCCAVSKHPITHQQAVLLKPSGKVVLESVLKDCVYKDNRCPITGIKIRGPEDVLKLQMGGTGFSSHNNIEAKKFSHIRSRAGDDRTQQGHLPRAGYVGLH